MSSEQKSDSGDPQHDGDSQTTTDLRVLLLMENGRDRELVAETLGTRYRIETATTPDALDAEFDCCVLDQPHFSRVTDAVQERRELTDGVFLPFVVLVDSDSGSTTVPTVWEYVDDVLELPVGRAELQSRIGNLLERRRTALELDARSTQLEATVAELELKERAMDKAPVGITITDPTLEGNPLIYANDRFQELTGYEYDEVVGRNCRFLQGKETDPETKRRLREAVGDERSVSVDIVNYRKNGQQFWQKLDITPVHDEDGKLENFVGFQTEITDRKIRERRLEVLNRVLRHNLKNKMNLIEGHLTLLEDECDDDRVPKSFRVIEDAASDLMGLAEAVQKSERIMAKTGSTRDVIVLEEQLTQVLSSVGDRFPEARFDLSVPDEPCAVTVPGLITAIEEAVENAVVHNDSPRPSVEIRVDRRGDGWIDIEIADDGPGIPDREVSVLKEGETPLNHAERLGLWVIYWVVNRAGGEFEVSNSAADGTALTLSVPEHTDG